MKKTEYERVTFETLKGLTLKSIVMDKKSPKEFINWQETEADKSLWLESIDGTLFIMCHPQDCCESVTIEDIAGELEDIIGSEILLAEEVTKTKGEHRWDGHETWTFYKLSTIKGSVTIRWYGTSNGYYSESVFLYRVKEIEVPDVPEFTFTSSLSG